MRIPLIYLCLCVFAALPAHAQHYDTEQGRAAFTGSIPVNSFTGISQALAGEINLIDRSVVFSLELATLKTGIRKRDSDMRRALDTRRFPTVTFTGALVSDFDPSLPEVQPATVRGTMTLHGISQEIEVHGGLQHVEGGLLATATWTLNMRDYGIEPPRLLIMKVDEEVEVRVEAMLLAAAQ